MKGLVKVNKCVLFAGTLDYSSPYEAKLTKTLKKFTAKPVTQVCRVLNQFSIAIQWNPQKYSETFFSKTEHAIKQGKLPNK